MRTLTALACLLFMACQSQQQEPPVQEKSTAQIAGEVFASHYITVWDCVYSKIFQHDGESVNLELFMDFTSDCMEANISEGFAESYRDFFEPLQYVSRNEGTLEDFYASKGIDIESVPENLLKHLNQYFEGDDEEPISEYDLYADIPEKNVNEILAILDVSLKEVKIWYDSYDEEYWKEVGRKFPAPKLDNGPADGNIVD